MTNIICDPLYGKNTKSGRNLDVCYIVSMTSHTHSMLCQAQCRRKPPMSGGLKGGGSPPTLGPRQHLKILFLCGATNSWADPRMGGNPKMVGKPTYGFLHGFFTWFGHDGFMPMVFCRF